LSPLFNIGLVSNDAGARYSSKVVIVPKEGVCQSPLECFTSLNHQG